MNPKAVIPLIAGLGLAGFAVKLGWDQIRAARAAASDVVHLWAPVQTIERGSPVNPEMLKELEFPARLAPPGAMVDKAKIAGRVPMVDLSADLPIVASMLLPPGASPGIIVPEGLRAVAVKIDESSGVDNHLHPGCWVDVIGMFTVRVDNRSQTIAKTIIENVQVAAVGARLALEKPTPGSTDASKKSDKPARAVTVLLKPEQVPVLHLAEQRGKIKLSLRNNVSTVEERARREYGDFNYEIDEDELLTGRKREAPQEESDGKPTFMEQLTALFQPKAEPQDEPAAEEPVEQEPPQPEYVWTMAIYNGSEKTVLGWTAQDPTRPVELGSDGPSIFEQDGGAKSQPVPGQRKPKTPAQPKDKQRKPVAEGSDPNDRYKPGGQPGQPVPPPAKKDDAPQIVDPPVEDQDLPHDQDQSADETKELFE